MRIPQLILEVSTSCPQPTDHKDTEQHRRCRPDSLQQILVTPFNSWKSQQTLFIGSHCVSRSPTLSLHTQFSRWPFHKETQRKARHTRDKQSDNRRLCSVRLLFRKMGVEMRLKKQSPAASPAQTDCFLDSSGVRLPQPALSPSTAPWHFCQS